MFSGVADMKLHNSPTRLKMVVFVGVDFGYPRCCIDHFHNALKAGILPPTTVPRGVWYDAETGYVPCPKCVKLMNKIGLDEFVSKFINPNRHPALPKFPNAFERDVLKLYR